MALTTAGRFREEDRSLQRQSLQFPSVVTIDGGQWLQGAGQFNFLKRLTDEDWAAIRPKKSS